MEDVPSTMPVETPRPRLSPWITVHHPIEDGAQWIVERHDGNPLRVSDDLGHLLSAIDGERNVDALAKTLGKRWTPELVVTAVNRLADLGLLAERDAAPPKPKRRFVVVSATTVQLRLFHAARVLEAMRPVLTRLPGYAVMIVTIILTLGGLSALVAQHAVLGQALGTPLPINAALLIWLGLAITTIFHEFSHGATLTHFRGKPGWFGVMIFYLTPACFCEVTDGWRLRRPKQRVAVALAGVATQTSIAGAASLIAVTMPGGDARNTLVMFAVVCYVSGVINLVPWVKLDGYLALMAYLDLPHLRDKAMTDARGWLARRFFGVRSTRQLPQRWWAVPYGMVCIIFPALVLTLAVGRWSHLLLNVGFLGAGLMLLLIAYLGYRIVRATFELLRKAHRRRVSWIRQAAVALLACLVLATLLTFIKVRNNVQAGYVNDGTGVHLVVPPGSDFAALRPGDRVVLQRSGLLFSTEVGTAKIGVGKAVAKPVAFNALMPFRSDIPIDAVVIPLDQVQSVDLDDAGSAILPGESLPLGPWLMSNYVTPAWKQVAG